MIDHVQLKDRFAQLRERFTTAHSYEQFQLKDKSVHYFLYDEIIRVHVDSVRQIKTIDAEPAQLLLEVNHWIGLLKRDRDLKLRSHNPIKNKLGKLLHDFLESLEELKVAMPEVETVPPSGYAVEKPKKKQAVYEYNRPVIKQSQVLLLMHYLRKNSLLISDIDDTTLADCFGTLTGFSCEQLRKKYVDFKKDGINYKSEDLNELGDLMIKVGKAISEHS